MQEFVNLETFEGSWCRYCWNMYFKLYQDKYYLLVVLNSYKVVEMQIHFIMKTPYSLILLIERLENVLYVLRTQKWIQTRKRATEHKSSPPLYIFSDRIAIMMDRQRLYSYPGHCNGLNFTMKLPNKHIHYYRPVVGFWPVQFNKAGRNVDELEYWNQVI